MALEQYACIIARMLNAVSIASVTMLLALASRIYYMQKMHPLSGFPGPWLATSFSVVGAIISIRQREPEWFMELVEKYGSKHKVSDQRIQSAF